MPQGYGLQISLTKAILQFRNIWEEVIFFVKLIKTSQKMLH